MYSKEAFRANLSKGNTLFIPFFENFYFLTWNSEITVVIVKSSVYCNFVVSKVKTRHFGGEGND